LGRISGLSYGLAARSCGEEGGKADMTSAAPGRLATEVRDRRTELRLRQDELADLAGVSERFVYALERGKPTVQLDKVLAVLNALGLHLQIHRGAAGDIR
jgi:HTH-type transcriptional regulator/antitoxin HipB